VRVSARGSAGVSRAAAPARAINAPAEARTVMPLGSGAGGYANAKK